MNVRQDWVRTGAYVALIVATVVLSYATLRDRALHSGFPTWAAWLYPPAVDATIIVASRTWRDTTLSPRTRGLAAVVTLAAIVAGVAAFVVEHSSAGPVAVAFSAVVPLALASALVLTSWSATDRRDAQDITARDDVAVAGERGVDERAQRELVAILATHQTLTAAVSRAPQRRTTPPPRPTGENRTTRTSPRGGGSTGDVDPASVRWALDELAAGRTAGWRVVARERGLSEHRAKLAAAKAKDQHGTPALRAVERSAS